jgi:hypothetical protein
MPNQIVHWVGENPSIHTSSNGVVFDEILNYGYDVQPGGYTQVVTDVKKFGDSSFLIGTDSSWNGQRTRLQTAANTTLVGAADDFITSFWWKPTTDTFYAAPYYKGIVANGGHFIRTANGYDRSITDFRLEWFGPYHTAGVLASFELDLTGLPWLNFLSTRENGVLTLAITDENGNTFNDRHGNPCLATINAAGHASTNAMFQLGGVYGYYNTMGYYDDIVFVSGQSVDYSASLASNGSSFWLSEMSISGEPFVTAVVSNASAGQSDGSVTVTDSNFSGTKTYTFYDSNLNILQQGVSNTLNGLQVSSYTIQVSDTNGNQVSTIFAISEGGNNMAYITIASQDGLVLQKKMLRASGDLAAVLMVAEPESGIDKSSNAAFAEALTQRTAVASNLSDEAAARASDATVTLNARVAADGVNSGDIVAEQSSQTSAAASAAAKNTENAADRSDAMIAFASARSSAVKVEADAELAANVTLTTSVSDHEDGRGSLMTVLSDARSAQDASVAVLIAAEEAAEDAALAAEAGTRASEDASIGVRLIAELSTDAQGTMIDTMEGARIAGDSSVSVLLSAEVATEASKLSDEQAARSLADVALVADLDSAIAARGVLVGNASDARLSLDIVIDGAIDDMIADRGSEITAEAGLRSSGQATASALIVAEAAARAADMSVAVALRSDNQLVRSNAVAQESIDRASSVDAAAANALTSDGILAGNITSYGTSESTAWSDHGDVRAAADTSLETLLTGNGGDNTDALSIESAAMSVADLSLNTRIAAQASKRGTDMAAREAAMDALEAKFKFTGDGANGGDLVLAEAGGKSVTAKFVKINATLTKMFLS